MDLKSKVTNILYAIDMQWYTTLCEHDNGDTDDDGDVDDDGNDDD